MFTSYNSPCGMKCCFPGCLSKCKEDTSTTPKSYFSFPKDSSRYVLFPYFIKTSFFSYYLKPLYTTYFYLQAYGKSILKTPFKLLSSFFICKSSDNLKH